MQHALMETAKWFGDSASFVVGNYPWFGRGGSYFNGGSSAGVFFSNHLYGSSAFNGSSRSSLIIN